MYSFFIRRPIVAICISLLIFIGGLLTALSLPITQYPNVVPPQIMISTSYPGADCQTVADAIASPIEQQMSGVEGMAYMTSFSTNTGAYTLNVYFDVGSDVNIDEILSYLRYAEGSSQLPSETQEMGSELQVTSGPPMLVFALTAPDNRYSAEWMSNYAHINLMNPLLRTKGVGNVEIFGAGPYAMRIWLRPERMAALGITVSEIQSAIETQNTVNPVGEIGADPAPSGQSTTYTVRTQARLNSPEQFENIIIRAEGVEIVYLKDVARVELGVESYNVSAMSDGKASALIAITQSPGSNALDIVSAVQDTIAAHPLPDGMQLSEVLNTTTSVKLGIQEIVKTLIITLILVMLVIFVFLQGWRASIIALAVVPVSIMGTFIFFPLFDMQINTICLMGMVLAIGLVVDDAIVVVEAVQTRMNEGMPAIEATNAAMKEVANPIVTTALVLAAVFFPCMLLPGITGELFAQFAITIGIAILLSAFNALSLSPALAALLLREKTPPRSVIGRAGALFNRLFDRARLSYLTASGFLIRRGGLTVLLFLAVGAGIIPISQKIPDGFLPDEDEGYYFGLLQLPYGTSREVTEEASTQVVEMAQQNEATNAIVAVNGFNLMTGVESPNQAFFFVDLKHWDQRNPKTQSAKLLSEEFARGMNQLNTGGLGFAFTPPAIPSLGVSSDVSMMLEDRAGRGEDYLREQTEKFIKHAQNCPEIMVVQNLMASSTPQIYLELNVQKALSQGVDVAEAYLTLQCYLGSSFVNYFNLFGYQWQVYMQAEESARMDTQDLTRFYLPGKDGVKVPLSSLVDISYQSGPAYLVRQNMYNASMLDIVGQPQYTQEQLMDALEKCFAQHMPSDMGYSYTGMSYQDQKAQKGVNLTFIFALSGLVVYLLLASLYESWLLPLAVLLTIPIAVLGALSVLWMSGQSFNLYTEIGLIMLIGLAAKNAILVVEFAQNRLHEGMGVIPATMLAARVRLRPILMTSIAFIIGCLPLAFATGAGSGARHAVGVCVVGGMCTAAFICVFFNPFAYSLIARIRARFKKEQEIQSDV